MLTSVSKQADFEPIALERQGSKTCHNCSSLCKKFGKFGPQRIRRYRCKQCKRTFSEEHAKAQGPLGDMRISIDKAETILKLMLEGMSIRSIQRITGAHQQTILDLLVLAGEKRERIMNEKIKGIAEGCRGG